MPSSIGQCNHFKAAPKDQRYRIKHPGADLERDCSNYYECCDLCRIKIIATIYEKFQQFINGEEVEVIQCTGDGGHRFLAPMQFYILEEKDEENNQ